MIDEAAKKRPLSFLAGVLMSSFLALTLGACAPNVAPPPKVSQPAPAPVINPPVVQAPSTPVVPADTETKVGLLLPLSGPQASLGRSMLQAAEMGLFDVGNDDFKLTVRDSATPGGPAAASREVLSDKADIVLGPLFGAELKQAAGPVAAARVPMVSFSNDSSQAQPGVYVLGVTPESQIARVVSYAAGQGLKRFAIMTPNSAFGRLVLAAYQEQVVKAGGTIAQVTFYDPKSPDLTIPVREMADAYKRSGFDALMIPEGGQKLRAFAAMLPAFEMPTGLVRLLGTAQWQDPAIAAEPALAGGWFAAPAPDRFQTFAQRYANLYGAAPDPRAAIVYDAVTLAVALAQSKEGGDFSAARITDPSGFAGVTGVFRLTADGKTERGLAVLEVGGGTFNVKDPAPTTFAALIN
ncbi:penicillin-binding protein activator [Dongia sp.]|uniref:penicillin-binding protein activator n=1 Tax=Dongia sp. TaxID=1977262 RepID=UPI0035AED1A2